MAYTRWHRRVKWEYFPMAKMDLCVNLDLENAIIDSKAVKQAVPPHNQLGKMFVTWLISWCERSIAVEKKLLASIHQLNIAWLIEANTNKFAAWLFSRKNYRVPAELDLFSCHAKSSRFLRTCHLANFSSYDRCNIFSEVGFRFYILFTPCNLARAENSRWLLDPLIEEGRNVHTVDHRCKRPRYLRIPRTSTSSNFYLGHLQFRAIN